ncbi:hypothetical protein K3495_g3421 [Podosphaera aphanis]|nr:hypothetical protein K3495_g3421 [Podosphaera aphanis]
MAHPVPEIPGYYYDREKKKYFKILKAAHGLNVAYSSEDVKRRKTLDSRKEQLEHEQKRLVGRITQSEILNSFLPGQLLARECGRSPVDTSKILASGLKFCGRIDLGSSYSTREQNNSYFDVIPTPGQSCSSSLVLANDHEVSVSTIERKKNSHENLPTKERSSIRSRQQLGPLTSLSTNLHRRTILVSSFGCSTRMPLRLVQLENVSDKILALTEPACCLEPLSLTDRARRDEVDVLCSVPAPSTSSLLFALGTTDGIMLMSSQPTINNNQTCFTVRRNSEHTRHRRKNNVLAVNFLTGNPHVLLSGCRRGILAQIDLREEPQRSRKTPAIKHSSAITHLKSIGPCRVVVAGLESTLCQYDLRFNRAIDSRHAVSSQPIFSYPGYHNDGTIGLGFDVDVESGLIAAAQETHAGHHPIRIFSLRDDGKHLDSPFERISMDRRAGTNEVVKCIRFARDDDGTRTSLYAAQDRDIYKYA